MDHRVLILRHFPTLLSRWQGATVRLKELTSSHPTLRLLLQHSNRNGYLLVACIDPQYIEAPVTWSDAHIEIAADDGDGYFVLDTKAGVRIRTGGVEVKEFA